MKPLHGSSRIVGRISFCSLLLVAANPPAAAQDSAKFGPVVAFAIANDYKFQNSEAVILRRPDVDPADVVLMKKSKVTALLIEKCLDQLAVLRAVDGEKPTKAGTYRVDLPPKSKPKSPKAKLRDEEFSKTILSMLLQTDAKTLSGVGSVAYVDVRPRKQVVVIPRP